MSTVIIYTKPTCPYCKKAEALLASKGVSFTKINIADDPAERAAMIERANGRTTVPQIFINDFHVGGCDDLHALEERGELDTLLNSAS